ncbi:signal peptidase I [Thermococcus thioreducens]|uniref:Peptidase S24 n=1 Tax=Thermococcus thioreducens TaxID=277988 RepID=A0A0Q2M3G7_9EURY|nr:signal peptidase I [Thermococcus thioreducens]ASJ11654.1 signal peptidase I [Thermococcus thioreducens]KQH82609.1 peptidase S24 [Thermococcus thioreducens]SEW16175.1 signal peptidase, endoplasmic reticulum-type [Thermococcus thioreducens]
MRRVVEYLALTVIGILVTGSLVGMLIDRPVFMSYAYSGSMEPTINKGDVFFINPISRNPEVGDIIVFQTGDVWTVHRVYAITEDGYITKGDNNIATDQQSHDIPPIPKERIAGTVITVKGTPLRIPQLGNYLGTGLSDRGKVLLAGALILVGILAFAGDETSHSRKRKKKITVKFRTLYALASVFLLIMVAVSTFVSWETVPITYSVTSAGGLREGWYLPGEEFQQEITIKNRNLYPMTYFVSMGPTITAVSEDGFMLEEGEERSITVTLKAPQKTAMYSPRLQVNAYMPILPVPVLDALYRIHPMVPLLAILVEISLFLGIFYVILGIGNEDILRIRRRRTSLLREISEVFRT